MSWKLLKKIEGNPIVMAWDGDFRGLFVPQKAFCGHSGCDICNNPQKPFWEHYATHPDIEDQVMLSDNLKKDFLKFIESENLNYSGFDL